MTAAARQRKTRARRRQGLASMRVDIHEERFAQALVVSGRLTAEETGRRALVSTEHCAYTARAALAVRIQRGGAMPRSLRSAIRRATAG